MDLEHATCPTGINDGYTFQQTISSIIITFPISSGCDISKIEFSLIDTEKSIYAGIKGQKPNVCGKMWGSTFNVNHSLTNTLCKIIMQKEEHVIWPLFIDGPSIKGIDSKSLFVLGIFEDAKGNSSCAYQNYCKAAEQDYKPALLFLADALLSDTNPYDVPQNIEESISLLQRIPLEFRDDAITKRLASAMLHLGQKEKALNELKRKADEYPEVRLELAKRLSPLSEYKGNEPDQAVHHLEILAAKDNFEALLLLSQHLFKGCGTKKDKQRAIQIDKHLAEIDIHHQPVFKDRRAATSAAIALSLSLALIGTTVGLLIIRRRV